jgi:hypothetical protein
MADQDETRNLYGEALDDLSNMPKSARLGDNAEMLAMAQVKATEAAALASLAAADAGYAVRNELEALSGKLAKQ